MDGNSDLVGMNRPEDEERDIETARRLCDDPRVVEWVLLLGARQAGCPPGQDA